MNLAAILKVLDMVGPLVAQAPEFIEMYRQAVRALSVSDQMVAKAALADAQADNDEGHKRLQEKLAAAAKEGN
jgi:hypothetical protein